MPALLLIDDDTEVLSINAKYFKTQHYDVEYATNAVTAIQKLKTFTPHCIVMDIMMPRMDGFEACVNIKKICTAPIIFLTGKDSEDDKIKGLMLGADDYVVKPYSLRELDARIQVLLRQYQNVSSIYRASTSTLEYPFLCIDFNRHKVFYTKKDTTEEIHITNKEYDFLYLLASSPNKIFTFEEIGNSIWNGYLESDKKTIMVTASRLRKKLESYPELSKYIETVWSKGYRFVSK